MKKITSLFMGLVVLATASFAQPKMESKKADKKTETKMAPAPKMAPATKMSAAEKMKQTPKPAPVIKMVPKSDAKAAPVKKDGTPDKRFKANKGGKMEGPVKKDGTPDMRYKKNKPAEKKAA